MKKKSYLCPAQKVLKIETNPLLAGLDSGIPIVDGSGDEQLSKGYSSNIWSFMSADDNAAASQQADDDEDDF